MTFEQAFSKIKTKFDGADLTKLDSDFAIQVNMTDEDSGGAFYIQATDGKLYVEPYDYRDNTADVTVKRLDLIKILDKKLEISKALESGKLYINGNTDDFVKAVAAVKVAEKAPAKKTTVKKTATMAEKVEKPATKKVVSPAKAEAPKTEKKAPAKKTTKK
ncbi:MAG: SCP2 sterol-binding domain-containing protein [Clostridia bacterium]|nr:SCP2 sterol-binding domain-containing protein [Clostridia bacterium]